MSKTNKPTSKSTPPKPDPFEASRLGYAAFTPEQEARMVARAKKGDKKAIHDLAFRHLHLLPGAIDRLLTRLTPAQRSLLEKYREKTMGDSYAGRDFLLYAGVRGLLFAADRFRTGKGRVAMRFIRYAHDWVSRKVGEEADRMLGIRYV